MLFRLRSRLFELGNKHKDLIPELRSAGITAVPSELSNALSGVNTGPKATRIVSLANAIVTGWEKEQVGK